MKCKNTRRDFLKNSALTGAGVWLAGSSALAESTSANEQIQFACVGVGGKGRSDSSDAGRSGKVVAICDIDEQTMEKAAGRFKDAEKFFDFREMYDQLGDKFDAVTVSTPDHVHAVASAAALKMGKHTFTQKPLTRTIWESRRLGEIAREQGVQTMMGNQGTAAPGLRRTARQIQLGALGTPTEVHCWTNRPVWPQGIERPTEIVPVPAHVHWEQFLAGAEPRDYHPAYHPFKWRGWWEFGSGALGDMACHTLNLAFMALDLRDPTSVEVVVQEGDQVVSTEHNGETFPGRSKIRYEFPERNGRPALTMFWYDGGNVPSRDMFSGLDDEIELSKSGLLVIGDQGRMYSPNDYGEVIHWLEMEKMPDDVEFDESPGHFDEWVRGIKTGTPAVSNFPDYAGPLSETVLLGNLAVWSRKRVDWDAENLTITNLSEFDKPDELTGLIKPTYHNGYTV